MCKKYKCKYCHDDYPIKININPLTLTNINLTPLTLINSRCLSCSSTIIGANNIIFNKIGVYDVEGYVCVTNNATTVTNFQIVSQVLNGSAVINPSNITYGGVKINLPSKIIFNFSIQVTVPNTSVQLSARSTSFPLTITEGKFKINKIE
ncbi:hypothetical protein Catovirus_1_289 [Catovirus CTV1]|uniref:Uncharacterized protein n=1 Tax=Catovirus CTV1 TaxID=1977631 RepID=A0A1V0S960_9VIRU|nr:hypothetical protein Catovirus_1_289 [Catovirus CTV1]